MAEAKKSGGLRRADKAAAPSFAKWSKAFLAELAETSNVSASARKAGILTSRAYEARRTNPEFSRKWQLALCEGYDHLEMELLARLRSGEIKPAASAKRGVRTFENAIALRLLAAHRDAAAHGRGIRSNAEAEQVVLSINSTLERMRQRLLAPPEPPADEQ